MYREVLGKVVGGKIRSKNIFLLYLSIYIGDIDIDVDIDRVKNAAIQIPEGKKVLLKFV